jgi:DNA-binding NarL/FixJ family response regulator
VGHAGLINSMKPSGDTRRVAPAASAIGLPVDNTIPLFLPPAASQLRVLVITSAVAPLSGVAALLGASNRVESELFCVTRDTEVLRDIGNAPDIESARRAALAAAIGADAVMVVLHDEVVRLREHAIELGVETLVEVGLPVLILADLGDERTADFARAASWLRRQVRGVMSIDATATEIAAGVRGVSAGLVVIEPRVAELLQQTALRKRPPVRGAEAHDADQSLPLSAREREVLALLAEGLATKNIAHELGISAHTVKAHVESIFAKFGATTRAEAVAIGVRRGAVLL